jgi:hypothetical protein
VALLESVERGALFRLTRFLAFVVILALSLALVIGAFTFAGDLVPNQSAKVSFSEISSELHPASESNQPGSVPSPPVEGSQGSTSLDLPFVLQPYFSSADNRGVLMHHMDGLDSSERTEYLDNLTQVVEEGKRSGEDTTKVINTYFELKQTQLALAKADSSARSMRQLYIVASAVSIMFLIALASLILVLLAIERNTRRNAVT